MSTTTEAQHATEARSKLVARRTVLDRSARQNENDGAHLRHDGESRERTAGEEIAEVLVTLSDRERTEVDAIDAALARLDQGTWGRCGSCNKKIGADRLHALPEAHHCLDCASMAS